MSPYEGVLATQWLGLETVLPCHYITLDGDPDVADYMRHHGEARARGEAIADALLLRAGDWIEFDAAGKVVRPAEAAEPDAGRDLRRAAALRWPRRAKPGAGAGRGAGRGARRRALRRRPLHLPGQEPLRDLSADRRPRDRRRGRGATARAPRVRPSGTRVVVEPVHRLRPLLSLPDRQAELLRQPDRSSACIATAASPITSIAPAANLTPVPDRRSRDFEASLRRAGRDRRAGLPARRGRRRRTRCWCSAPARSGSPSSRWRGRAAPASTPPTSLGGAARHRGRARRHAARRRRRARSSAVLRTDRRRGHAGGDGGHRRGAGDGADVRPRRRRRARRHPRPGARRAWA